MASSSTTSNPNIRATLHAEANGYVISAYVTYEYIGTGSGYIYADSEFPTPVMSLGSGTTYPDTSFANSVHDGIFLGSTDTTVFTRTVATGGSKTITWTAGSGLRDDYEVTLDTTLNIATAPTGAFISSVEPGTDSFTLTGGVTSLGTGGSSAGVELVVLNQAYTASGLPQRYEGFTTLSATKTITNNSPASAGGITISPNTQYHLGVYASNGAADLRYDGGTAVTLAPAATVSSGTITSNSAEISYSTSADGGFYDKKVQYSLDGTTWTDGVTITGGSASSGSFTVSGLSSGTTYNIHTRVTTTAGSSVGQTVVVTTTGAQTTTKLYGSVNGYSKGITKLYGSVNGSTKEIKKLYGSVNGQTKLIYEAQ